jgi:phage terminase large subunit-like protein
MTALHLQRARLRALLPHLSDAEIAALPWLWDVWAMPHQLPPPGDWRAWVILGGRGAGKTRAGAEWVRSLVEGPRPTDPGRCKRVALVAETLDQAREVMVMGDSGLLAVSPPDRRPVWRATRRLLEWPNGATAQVFSASDPESLRGPQFDAAWADELAKWKKGEEAWSQLQLGLRLGDDPRACVTTTPRGTAFLRALLDQATTRRTHATTDANRANLARGFLEEVKRLYGGTRLGRQELEGLLIEDIEGALWPSALIEAARCETAPAPDRVVVAVDPAASSGRASDATGIVAVGVVTQGPPQDWRAFVLEDATVRGASPDAWGRAAVACARRHDADRIVAEANQGGEMVEAILRGIDPLLPVTRVHARATKAIRAEPAAALYEQGRVHHPKGANLGQLEDEMMKMTRTGWRGTGSPDRLDALVWALRETLVEPSKTYADPRLRSL